jgi:hypothetical protein
MQPYITRLGLFTAVLLTLTWLCRAPDWEPLSVFVAALFAYLGHVTWTSLQRITDHEQHLLTRFRLLFPKDSGTIFFLREHDFGDSFNGDYMSPLFEYQGSWVGADFMFCNRGIEKKRCSFDKALRHFLNYLALETYPHDKRPGWFTMDYNELHNSSDKEGIRTELNARATNFVQSYEDFVQHIRKYEKQIS